MRMNTRWLIIYDNYDNPKVLGSIDLAALDLRRYLPKAHQGFVIMTTRSAEVQLGFFQIFLASFEKREHLYT